MFKGVFEACLKGVFETCLKAFLKHVLKGESDWKQFLEQNKLDIEKWAKKVELNSKLFSRTSLKNKDKGIPLKSSKSKKVFKKTLKAGKYI